MCLAIPGEVLEIFSDEDSNSSGRVRFGQVVKTIHLAFVPEVKVGDYVIVHVGFAISILNEQQAREVWQLLEKEVQVPQ